MGNWLINLHDRSRGSWSVPNNFSTRLLPVDKSFMFQLWGKSEVVLSFCKGLYNKVFLQWNTRLMKTVFWTRLYQVQESCIWQESINQQADFTQFITGSLECTNNCRVVFACYINVDVISKSGIAFNYAAVFHQFGYVKCINLWA